MSITMQYITKSWEMHSWCLDCSGLNTEHTGECLKDAFEEKIREEWKLDIFAEQISNVKTLQGIIL